MKDEDKIKSNGLYNEINKEDKIGRFEDLINPVGNPGKDNFDVISEFASSEKILIIKEKEDVIIQFYTWTEKDVELLTLEQKLKYDKRTFFQYYRDKLLTTHMLLSALFYKSLLIPQFIRISLLCTSIVLTFSFNAVFFTDSHIDTKTNNTSPVK